MKQKLPALVLATLLYLQIAFAQAAFTQAQLKKLDSISTQDVPRAAPGIATAIIQNGQLVYEKYAGYADFRDSILISSNTRFNIASNGKQFTALAVLTLIDARKLRLTDDIRKFLPTLFPKLKDSISIQSLLNHTSGIRDCYDLWSLQGYTWWKKTFDNNDVLRLLEQQEDLNFKPNTAYAYSNTNYILLAMITERVSGQSFVAYSKEMFKKLGMPNTAFADDYNKIDGPVARAYFNFDTWTTSPWIWNVTGDGNLFSTLADQVQWERILQGRAKSKIKRAIILKSQQPIAHSRFKNYGYGLEFGRYKGMDYRFHEGATGAWKATVTRFPGKNTSMLTLTNTGKSIPSSQTRQMADLVFGLQGDAAYLVTKPATIGNFVSDDEIRGMYLTESDFSFQFEKRDGKMFLKRMGRNDVELEREGANIFHQKNDPFFKQEFTRNNKGDLQATAYYINHAPYSLTKTIADFSDFDFTRLNGKFINNETGTIIEIAYKADKNYDVKIAGRDKTKGLLLTKSKLMVNNYTILFDPAKSTIDTFYLNGERIKAVKFVRTK